MTRPTIRMGIRDSGRLARPCRLSVSEEIQNVTKRTCVGFIDFGVLATCAGNCSELLVLNIEELRRTSAGCGKLTSFKLLVLTFRALPIVVLHVIP